MSDEKDSDNTDKKKMTMSMGDLTGRVVKKGKKADDIKKDSKEDPGKAIMIAIGNKKVSLKEIEQSDFLKWIESVLPVPKNKIQKLSLSDLSDYKSKKKLFDQVVDFHTKAMVPSLKKAGYTEPPIM